MQEYGYGYKRMDGVIVMVGVILLGVVQQIIIRVKNKLADKMSHSCNQ